MEKKQAYVTPQTEQLEVRVERNFLDSIPTPKNYRGVQTFDDDDDNYVW